MYIQLLVDNVKSWILPYAKILREKLEQRGHTVVLLHKHKLVKKGDILCLLSCERIFKNLHLNKYNLVVHESALPKGKGWSPLTWQILEGKSKIPITLFEATEAVDAGNIYFQDFIEFEGHELIKELKNKQGEKTLELILKFVDDYQQVKGISQQGSSSFYERRRPKDSELDTRKTILEQFNLLRVCDNDRYPAFFIKDGIKYILKIEKA